LRVLPLSFLVNALDGDLKSMGFIIRSFIRSAGNACQRRQEEAVGEQGAPSDRLLAFAGSVIASLLGC
jgi:hypothetical protein